MTRSVKRMLLITMIAMTSLANGRENIGKPIAIGAHSPTATRSVPVLVSVPRIPRFKVIRSNPYRVSHFIIDDTDDGIEDDDLITPYRRRDLNKIEHEDGISDYVRWRLFLARQLALLKYREVHG